MKIHYEILKNKGLWIQKKSGLWSTAIFEEYLKILVKDSDWKYVTKAISDFRELNLAPLTEDLNYISTLKQKYLNKDYIHVFIVNTPISVPPVHMYNEIVKQYGYNFHYCSTVEHAIKLLDLGINTNGMEVIFKNLKNQF